MRASADRAATTIARPGRRVSRSAVAAGPTSSAVRQDRADRVSADSATASAIASRYSAPTRPDREPPRGGELGADRAQQQRAVERRHDRRPRRRRTRRRAGASSVEREDRAEQDRDRRAGRARETWCRGTGTARRARSPRRARCRSRGRGRAARWIPISSMTPAAATTAIATNPHSGLIPTRIRARPAGRADVAERLARERLAADHGEHADDAGRRPPPAPPTASASCTGALEKKPGRDDRCETRAARRLLDDLDRVPPAWSTAACRSSPAPATTSTRPWTRSTSTWWP